jgi:hypothetical protein
VNGTNAYNAYPTIGNITARNSATPASLQLISVNATSPSSLSLIIIPVGTGTPTWTAFNASIVTSTNATTGYKFQAKQQCTSYCLLDGIRQLIQVTFAFSLVSFMPGQNYTIELQGSTSTSLSLDSIYSFKLLQPTPPSAPCTESLSLDSYTFGAGSSTNNVTMYLRNFGGCNIALRAYYVKDANGNQYALTSWSGPTITPSNVVPTTIFIGSACPSCILTGTAFSFQSGFSYTITIATSRGNQFRFTVTK